MKEHTDAEREKKPNGKNIGPGGAQSKKKKQSSILFFFYSLSPTSKSSTKKQMEPFSRSAARDSTTTASKNKIGTTKSPPRSPTRMVFSLDASASSLSRAAAPAPAPVSVSQKPPAPVVAPRQVVPGSNRREVVETLVMSPKKATQGGRPHPVRDEVFLFYFFLSIQRERQSRRSEKRNSNFLPFPSSSRPSQNLHSRRTLLAPAGPRPSGPSRRPGGRRVSSAPSSRRRARARRRRAASSPSPLLPRPLPEEVASARRSQPQPRPRIPSRGRPRHGPATAPRPPPPGRAAGTGPRRRRRPSSSRTLSSARSS